MPDLAKIIAEAYKIFGKATLSKVLSKARLGAGSVGKALKEFHESQGTGIRPSQPPKPSSAYRGFEFDELRPETQQAIIEQEQRSQSTSLTAGRLPRNRNGQLPRGAGLRELPALNTTPPSGISPPVDPGRRKAARA
jgi:hypothetical protein